MNKSPKIYEFSDAELRNSQLNLRLAKKLFVQDNIKAASKPKSNEGAKKKEDADGGLLSPPSESSVGPAVS